MKILFLILMTYLVSFSNAQQKGLDSFFFKIHQNKLFNGVALVYNKGDIVFFKPYGMANVEWDIKLTGNCKFEKYSIQRWSTSTQSCLQ